MQHCKLTIITSVDGQETEFSCEGRMLLSAYTAKLVYAEENAKISLIFEKETVQVSRQGDYTLRLNLQQGERTNGVIGIGGNEGDIETYTHAISYSIGKDSLLASLRYDLLLGGEIQKMKLRIIARFVR